MAIKSIEITSAAEFVANISKLHHEWCGPDGTDGQLWFRGQKDSTLPLVPKQYRYRNVLEHDLRAEFERRGSQLIVESRPSNDWEWYFLMQHFGAPTRLLDWSDGGLLALYFALRFHHLTCDAAVWVLEPCWLNKQTADTDSVLLSGWPETSRHLKPAYEGTLRVTMPIAVDPNHVARRLTVQHSRFTIHGTARFGLEQVAGKAPRPKLLQLRIPRDYIEEILDDLDTCGIVETTVFPDLEGLSRELTIEWARQPMSDEELRRGLKASRTRWKLRR